MIVDADSPIECLNLATRTRNCLRRARIDTVGQLASMTEDQLMGLPYFGVGSLVDTRARLHERYLPMKPQSADSGREEEMFLLNDEVADLLRVPRSTLASWRSRGLGPPWAKVGRRVIYLRTDVLSWVADLKGQEVRKAVGRVRAAAVRRADREARYAAERQAERQAERDRRLDRRRQRQEVWAARERREAARDAVNGLCLPGATAKNVDCMVADDLANIHP